MPMVRARAKKKKEHRAPPLFSHIFPCEQNKTGFFCGPARQNVPHNLFISLCLAYLSQCLSLYHVVYINVVTLLRAMAPKEFIHAIRQCHLIDINGIFPSFFAPLNGAISFFWGLGGAPTRVYQRQKGLHVGFQQKESRRGHWLRVGAGPAQSQRLEFQDSQLLSRNSVRPLCLHWYRKRCDPRCSIHPFSPFA